MKISYKQLKNYINTDKTSVEIAEILTTTGLEAEGIEKFESVKGGMQGIVIAKVLSKEKHPNADKLSITTVDTGDGNATPVVCGAPNVEAGQKVVIAKVGTTLYNNEGEALEIKKAKIRGQVSEGMICAEDEIGLGDSHEGIMVLPDDAKIGTPANEYFELEEDEIISIDLTPNRGDGASHFGAARDLYARLNYSGEDVVLSKPSVDHFKTDNTDLPISVNIKNTDACKRYAGLTVSGVEVKDSPAWLQNRLKAIGLSPINNVVDVTNFVLHEIGQPLHAFDADKIKGNKIIVDTSPDGTPFTTLDEMERKLTDKDLMICNAEEPMCIGGVMGGTDSGVTSETKDIFLESALFDSVYIRKTSKHHTLQTDASYRFERGVDPENVIYALKRAALLIKETAGGQISSEIVDEYPEPVKPSEIFLKFSKLERLIGTKIPTDDVKKILNLLDFEVSEETEQGLQLLAPLYRADVTREADVIEEILRIYGYNNVEFSHQIKSSLSYAPKPDKNKQQNTVSDFLTADGYAEAMSNSLTKAEYFEKISAFDENETVSILNPLSKDLNAMRQSLVFGKLEATARNISHRNDNVRLYEFGNVYKLTNANTDGLKKYHEQEMLALTLSGNKKEQNWRDAETAFSFFDIKSDINAVLQRLSFDIDNFKLIETDSKLFAYGLQWIFDGKILAEAGKISLELTDYFDIEQGVFYGEINWSLLISKLPEKRSFTPLLKYPAVRRDLALLINKDIRFEQIENIARKSAKNLLKASDVFDIFEDEAKLGKDKRSYAVSFIFQDEKKTLKDKQVNKIMNKIMADCKAQLGAEIR
jgi:phenylalanyl-tRNA synthetase beta chain